MPDSTPDSTPGDYSLPLRIAAITGLFLVGLLAYVLIDIASGGKLSDCADCGGRQESTEDA